MLATENFKIWISYMLDNQAIEAKLLLKHESLLLLLNNLYLPNYSNSIQELIVIGMAQSSAVYAENERIMFRKKQNKIEIYINLDYQKLLQATENQVFEMVAECYLQAVARFLSKRKDFDHQLFYSDLEKLFATHGYLPTKNLS